MSIPKDYVERVYAGWLGKIIGVRHGANIEGWTYERIQKAFGEINGYLHEFKNFAADDDNNGPIFFLRALEDYTYTSNITPREMGLTWLNYVPDNHGFFWWGGYGTSTENTAYLNLKNGIMAPRSGSINQNGSAVAEQIGGQIFSDCWGLIAPGDPKLAAEYAEKMSSVSHDGNGKYGGMFIAACIAEAFVEDDVEKIITKALSVIPSDCEYITMSQDIINFFNDNPDNWRDCFKYVKDNYGYDRYPGNVHVIPNSAVIILSLLYSKGDFSKSINISNMCGWDTDCNVGNVGTISGVLNGLTGIDKSWRKPINDFVCASSVIGSLNILDIPWLASYTANLGYKIDGTNPPKRWRDILKNRGINYHFEYPGSTHSFRLESDDENTNGFLENSYTESYTGERSLKIIFDNVNGGHGYRTYVKTYYEPKDFNDSRYDPAFSPILYPGQKVSATVLIPINGIKDVKARLYIKDRNSNKKYFGNKVALTAGQWKIIEFKIPYMENVCIDQVGIEFIPIQEERRHLDLPTFIAYLDNFSFSDKPEYSIDFTHEKIEVWNSLHKEVSQLTYLRGLWTLENDELSGSYYGEFAEAYTGDLRWEDYTYEVEIIPKSGDFHNINFRVQGAIRSYAVGLSKNERVVLYKNDNGYEELTSVNYKWYLEKKYNIKVDALKNKFKIFINNELVIEYEDKIKPYLNGQIGFSNENGSHTHYKKFTVKGLPLNK